MTGGPVGTPSFREYETFELDNLEHVRAWNLVIDRPQDTKDMRWADCLKYFPYGFTVASNCLPPASVHLPDSVVGQLLGLAKAGLINLKTLGERWPNLFNQEGKLHKARRPMGDPYVINGKIGATNGGAQLLCGANFAKKLPKLNDPPGKWYWLCKSKSNISKDRLVATELDPRGGSPSDQLSHLPALTKDQRKQNRQPKGYIFDDDSGEPAADLRVTWKDGSTGPRKVKPSPVNAIRRRPDHGEDSTSIEAEWDDIEADLGSFQGRLGLLAFANETPKLLKRSHVMGMTDSQLNAYKSLADAKAEEETIPPRRPKKQPAAAEPDRSKATPEPSKSKPAKSNAVEDDTAPKRQKTQRPIEVKPGKHNATPELSKKQLSEANAVEHNPAPRRLNIQSTEARSHVDNTPAKGSHKQRTSPEPTPGLTHGSREPAKNTERFAEQKNSVGRFGFRKSSVLSSSSTSTSEDVPATAIATADALSLVKKLQSYEDAFAHSQALTVRYVNESKDLLHQTLGLITANVDDLAGTGKQATRAREDLSAFSKHVMRRSDKYALAFLSEVGERGDVLRDSRYDLDQTHIINAGQSRKWFLSQTFRDKLPHQMPGLAEATTFWAKEAASYPVSDALASTEAYRELTERHLRTPDEPANVGKTGLGSKKSHKRDKGDAGVDMGEPTANSDEVNAEFDSDAIVVKPKKGLKRTMSNVESPEPAPNLEDGDAEFDDAPPPAKPKKAVNSNRPKTRGSEPVAAAAAEVDEADAESDEIIPPQIPDKAANSKKTKTRRSEPVSADDDDDAAEADDGDAEDESDETEVPTQKQSRKQGRGTATQTAKAGDKALKQSEKRKADALADLGSGLSSGEEQAQRDTGRSKRTIKPTYKAQQLNENTSSARATKSKKSRPSK